MIHRLIAKSTTANAVRLANVVRSANAVHSANAVRSANAVHTPPFGHPGGSSVRLSHLTYIRSCHGPRLFGACNKSLCYSLIN